MTALPARHRWLLQLTDIPTASGSEHWVVGWVDRWLSRRPDLARRADSAGNLLLTIRGRKRRPPIVATAHLDHPAFVVTDTDGRDVYAEFRGGVMAPYFEKARVDLIDVEGSEHPATVVEYDQNTAMAKLRLDRTAPVEPKDIGRWRFPSRRLGISNGLLRAGACDDLAGVAAALTALDKARKDPALRHFAVLLTRAEEVGFVGAIAAAKLGTIPDRAKLLSIETSRSFADSPVGGGPIVRVGDRSTVFDSELTNRLTEVVRAAKIPHQRKLMDGGSCEATAFGAYGLSATGLCLPLGNYHNMVDIDGVVAGASPGKLGPEVVSLSDYDGLVKLMLAAAARLDTPNEGLTGRLDDLYDAQRHILRQP
ncbi:MAG TPA: hypothetical protein ENH15_01820 [Actinobacteria bacterium]|nr:hypothetical protein [Actinomycetota bacterium]